MEYQPFNNNLDLNELLQNVGDGLEQGRLCFMQQSKKTENAIIYFIFRKSLNWIQERVFAEDVH